jgi:hypothetical protein
VVYSPKCLEVEAFSAVQLTRCKGLDPAAQMRVEQDANAQQQGRAPIRSSSNSKRDMPPVVRRATIALHIIVTPRAARRAAQYLFTQVPGKGEFSEVRQCKGAHHEDTKSAE